MKHNSFLSSFLVPALSAGSGLESMDTLFLELNSVASHVTSAISQLCEFGGGSLGYFSFYFERKEDGRNDFLTYFRELNKLTYVKHREKHQSFTQQTHIQDPLCDESIFSNVYVQSNALFFYFLNFYLV